MQSTQATKFSVIIPTRERSDTLQSSLKTCVGQDYDNLEIIVSDNFSTDNTREVVESFDDPRIRYINLPEFKSQVQLSVTVRGQAAVASWLLLPASKRSTNQRLHTAYPGTTIPDPCTDESRT